MMWLELLMFLWFSATWSPLMLLTLFCDSAVLQNVFWRPVKDLVYNIFFYGTLVSDRKYPPLIGWQVSIILQIIPLQTEERCPTGRSPLNLQDTIKVCRASTRDVSGEQLRSLLFCSAHLHQHPQIVHTQIWSGFDSVTSTREAQCHWCAVSFTFLAILWSQWHRLNQLWRHSFCSMKPELLFTQNFCPKTFCPNPVFMFASLLYGLIWEHWLNKLTE